MRAFKNLQFSLDRQIESEREKLCESVEDMIVTVQCIFGKNTEKLSGKGIQDKMALIITEVRRSVDCFILQQKYIH